MAKYSLVASSNSKRCVISLEEYDSTKCITKYCGKVNLSTIDKLTTSFWNFNELIDFLLRHNKIDFKPDSLYIEYNYQGIQRLPIAYKNNKYLPYFAHISSTYIPLDDLKFQEFAQDFILSVRKNKNIMREKYISLYLKNKFIDLFENPDMVYRTINEDRFIIKKITEQLATYKQARDILLNVPKYAVKKPVVENKVDVRLSDANTLSSEDKFLNIYESYGMDGVYGTYDLDDIEKLPDHIKKLIR